MGNIHYARVDEVWRKEQKYVFLTDTQHGGNVAWQAVQPDARQTWLTEGIRDEFETFICLGDKEAKSSTQKDSQVIFTIFSNGVKTNRDSWAYNFSAKDLTANITNMMETYNGHVFRLRSLSVKPPNIDDFVLNDDKKISWSGDLKEHLLRGITVSFDATKIRNSIYRPFTKSFVYLDQHLNNRRYLLPRILPIPQTEPDNHLMCVGGYGRKPFSVFVTNSIPDLNFYADPAQCFPFYTYNEDGTNRRENITDWALAKFRTHYQDPAITKWNIFHYVYALLHHPEYRTRYAANLKRELPRIPFAPAFHAFAQAGARLAELHVHYEQQSEYPLEKLETPGAALDWRVEKMRLSKDKRRIVYNDFLTLDGIPPETFEYRLGNRSALEWVIDQYQVSTDKRSGITNDPNRADDPSYIVRLIGQVITVSLETMKIVQALPGLFPTEKS